MLRTIEVCFKDPTMSREQMTTTLLQILIQEIVNGVGSNPFNITYDYLRQWAITLDDDNV